jgi:hypothetical protein
MANMLNEFVHAFPAPPGGIGIIRHAAIQRRPFLSIQDDPELLDDLSGDLALQFQGVVNISLVTLGPDVSLGGCVDQARVDSNPVAG